jgi:hypothetical protein
MGACFMRDITGTRVKRGFGQKQCTARLFWPRYLQHIPNDSYVSRRNPSYGQKNGVSGQNPLSRNLNASALDWPRPPVGKMPGLSRQPRR